MASNTKLKRILLVKTLNGYADRKISRMLMGGHCLRKGAVKIARTMLENRFTNL